MPCASETRRSKSNSSCDDLFWVLDFSRHWCTLPLAGEFSWGNAIEKDLDRSFTCSSAVVGCGGRRPAEWRNKRDASHARHRFQRFEFASFRASSQARQEFASQGEPSPRFKASQLNTAIVAATR